MPATPKICFPLKPMSFSISIPLSGLVNSPETTIYAHPGVNKTLHMGVGFFF